MAELKGSKTEKNLWEAFAGESQARNKYSYFASKAKKEGYVQIANLFEETANNEKEHAKIWFKLLNGGEISNTAENLKEAAEGELKGVLGYTDEPLVSKDFCGNANSSIVDGLSTMVIEDNMVKVVSWYDNEWGYSNRVLDLASYIASKGL